MAPELLGKAQREAEQWSEDVRLIDPLVMTGPWKWLVFGHPARTDNLVDRNAYVFCVLEQFHRHLKRREIHAPASSRWREPDAQLLKGRPGQWSRTAC
jgi:hypothetical protein